MMANDDSPQNGNLGKKSCLVKKYEIATSLDHFGNLTVKARVSH